MNNNIEDSLFGGSTNERKHKLLENFDVIGTLKHLALVPGGKGSKILHENVRAALVASTLNLASLDYVKRHYCNTRQRRKSIPISDAYIASYSCAKSYITKLLKKLQTEDCPSPSLGIFGAAVALERLRYSFFCAHFLFSMGHEYEGYAISRLILEQIAWAYTAQKHNDITVISKIKTTRAITQLKHFAPATGKIYGFLSNKTHIDYSSHAEFLRIENGQNVILHTQQNYFDYCRVTLYLADLFGLVWELSQIQFIKRPEAIIIGKKGPIPNPKRPFIKTINKCVGTMEKILAKDSKKAT